MNSIDLNCDLGEGAGHDSDLMQLVTSANIACGGHAGDAVTMRAAVTSALLHGVAVGAHPGFPDKEGFGRRERFVEPRDAAAMVTTQVRALQEVTSANCARVGHVKLHGALYNQASWDAALATSIAAAVRAIDPGLVLFALAGSRLLAAGRSLGLRVASEVFADRTYRGDGSLTPRSQGNALVADEDAAVEQVLGLARNGTVRSIDGGTVALEADTICIHGDGPHPVDFALRLRAALAAAGVEVRRM